MKLYYLIILMAITINHAFANERRDKPNMYERGEYRREEERRELLDYYQSASIQGQEVCAPEQCEQEEEVILPPPPAPAPSR